MIDFTGKRREAAVNGSGRQARSSLPFSRRSFLIKTSCFGAFYAVAKLIPLPALAAELADDSRVSQTPLVDKGFALVRKIGNGLYATISDPSKGNATLCNGGFLAGKDGALLIEGFTTPAGRGIPDGSVAHGLPSAGEGRPGHALPLRPFHGKFILRREWCAALDARHDSQTQRGQLRAAASRG